MTQALATSPTTSTSSEVERAKPYLERCRGFLQAEIQRAATAAVEERTSEVRKRTDIQYVNMRFHVEVFVPMPVDPHGIEGINEADVVETFNSFFGRVVPIVPVVAPKVEPPKSEEAKGGWFW